MKNLIIFSLISLFLTISQQNTMAQDNSKQSVLENTALIIIDIQNFYFPGGSLPLINPEIAAQNAQKILYTFREKQISVIHVKHNSKSGSEIHQLVTPIEGEKVISKDKANSFVGTDLLEYLQKNQIHKLVLCGMQTHMCVEAATRAASDYGFECTVIEDACTTRDLTFGDITISAKDVHYSTLSALKGTYAKIETTTEFLKKID